jgi:SAM-dependent methyltransferase
VRRRGDIGDPKRIVADGYDVIGEEYAKQAVAANDSTRAHYTSVLIEGLPLGADVLDLGCGAGLPTTAKLAEHFYVTGVDISAKQVERARMNVPNATFICADIAALDFGDKNFDSVAAFFSIIHLPRD